MEKSDLNRDPRVYLAVERTFLAWLRTGLALMGFGFVVARFGLLIRELSLSQTAVISNYGISTRFGTALVIAGVAVTLISLYRYRRLLDRLERGEMLRGPSRLVVTIALLLAVIGAMVAVRLMQIS